ncbi:hypothetical protein [Thiomonas sp.]
MTINEPSPCAPPLPAPEFLQSAPLKVWQSPAGIWFLRSEALQVGGILLRGADGHIWRLYAPCDGDRWAGILQGLAADFEAILSQMTAALPAANQTPA